MADSSVIVFGNWTEISKVNFFFFLAIGKIIMYFFLFGFSCLYFASTSAACYHFFDSSVT